MSKFLSKKQTKAFKVFVRWEEVEEELEWNLTLPELVQMGVGILGSADPYITLLHITPVWLQLCWYPVCEIITFFPAEAWTYIYVFNVKGLFFYRTYETVAAPVSAAGSTFVNDSRG